jgi:hypothetical protein
MQAAPPVPHLPLVVPARQLRPSQQPVGHETASQTQAPPAQRLPSGQASVAPQAQTPAAEQASARVGSQATQVPPSVPHAASAPGLHAPFAQQPPGQDWASQTQAPLTHLVPAPQAAPLPQRQAPVTGLQPSACAGSQATHAAPPRPQLPNVGAAQAPPLQQPLGHDSASHTQLPATQLVPAPQAAPAPQRHPPEAAQLSARETSQVTQAAPPVPHATADPADVQVEPEQQPLGQLDELQSAHAPPAQLPLAQVWQAAPPVPQAAALLPGRQVLPEQQPLGHEVASQTHAPPTQRAPSGHAAPAPHTQAPAAEQASAVRSQRAHAAPEGAQAVSERARQVDPAQHPLGHEVASQTQLPPRQRWPAVQAGPAPQAHEPAAVQLSAVAVLQVVQAPPPVPQRAREAETQVVPSQQPFGQEVGSQTQAPATQRRPAPQTGPVPQAQLPDGAQRSAVSASQPTHAAPPVPQVSSEGALQVAPEQQPSGHEVRQPLQLPFVQLSPEGQTSQ